MEMPPILEEGIDDLTGPNAACEPTKDENKVDGNKFNWMRYIDEEKILLTKLKLVDH